MKKIAIITLLIISAAACCQAQTAIFKKYAGHRNIKASCIEGYPIGDGFKATATMLKCQTQRAYKAVEKELRALPYEHRFPNDNEGAITRLFQMLIEMAATGDTCQLESLDLDGADGTLMYDFATESDISYTTPGGKTKRLSTHAADPLKGDKETYAIFFCPQKRTIIIFHCPNRRTYSQAVKFIMDKEFNNK